MRQKTWFNKLENYCDRFILDKLKVATDFIGEENMATITAFEEETIDNYIKFKKTAIEIFKKETNQDNKEKFYNRKQQEGESYKFFYAELSKLAKDTLLDLNEQAKKK